MKTKMLVAHILVCYAKEEALPFIHLKYILEMLGFCVYEKDASTFEEEDYYSMLLNNNDSKLIIELNPQRIENTGEELTGKQEITENQDNDRTREKFKFTVTCTKENDVQTERKEGSSQELSGVFEFMGQHRLLGSRMKERALALCQKNGLLNGLYLLEEVFTKKDYNYESIQSMEKIYNLIVDELNELNEFYDGEDSESIVGEGAMEDAIMENDIEDDIMEETTIEDATAEDIAAGADGSFEPDDDRNRLVFMWVYLAGKANDICYKKRRKPAYFYSTLQEKLDQVLAEGNIGLRQAACMLRAELCEKEKYALEVPELWYRKAVDPYHYMAVYQVGQCRLVDDFESKAAKKMFLRALVMKEDCYKAIYKLALLSEREGDYEAALQYYHDIEYVVTAGDVREWKELFAIELEYLYKSYWRRGIICSKQKRYQECIEYYSSALLCWGSLAEEDNIILNQLLQPGFSAEDKEEIYSYIYSKYDLEWLKHNLRNECKKIGVDSEPVLKYSKKWISLKDKENEYVSV